MAGSFARPSLLALTFSLGVLAVSPCIAAEMDHSGMDHSAMGHSQSKATPASTARTPIPVLTDADRQAAFPPA